MEAARIAVLLDKLNRERKAIETHMLEEAVARAERLIEADPDVPLLLIGADGWHKGVVGWWRAGSPTASTAPPA
jgi:single-stranded-DNA-specific exonuclease